MRRLISGIMIFVMLFSTLVLSPMPVGATADESENTGILPITDTTDDTDPEQGDSTTESDEFPKEGYVNSSNVNVRTGAGTSYDVVYMLNENDPVTIYQQERVGDMDWGQLADGNWISLTYVTFKAVTPEPEEPEVLTSSQAFVDILKSREGFSPTPYWDVSHYSIGYGTSVPSSKVDYYKKNPITEAEGEAMMREHLLDFENAVLKFAKKYNLTLTQNQFDAIVSFSYNCGDAWLSETNGYMNRAVREGWTGSDFVYAMCLWSRAGTDYILMNRRMYESNMYLNNIYQEKYNYENGTFRYVFLEAGQGAVRYIVNGYDCADPKPVRYEITKLPAGVDKNGNPFTYEFAGWYTAPENGELVEILDNKVPNGTVLRAMWKDPDGNIVYLEKGTPCNNVQVTVTNVSSSANVRSGPGTYYPKTGTIKKGTTVTLLRVYDDGKTAWGQYEGGWFSLEYSDYDGSLEETEEFPQYGVVNSDGVNVRSGAGTDNPSQYKLNTGAAVTILQKTKVGSMVWGQLEDGNWISMSYVTITPNPTPEPEPDPEPEPEPDGFPKAGYVNANNVNVRSGAGKSYSVVYTLNQNESVTIQRQTSADNMDWGQLEDGNWIALTYVTYGVPPEPEPTPNSPDMDGSGTVDKDDAVYLLRHVVYPEQYPISVNGDLDGNGKLDKDDAIYLLRHVVYPDLYPLKYGE